MKKLTRLEIAEILQSRRFDEFIDVLETDEVDFKDQTYLMENDRQKYALAEDVTALANHEGGIIIMGCRTTAAQNMEGDIVTEIRPLAQEICKFEIWRSICNDLIYPPIKGLEFNFHEVLATNQNEPVSKGLASISIPKSSEADRPHLLAHIISDANDRKVTTKYGLVVRTGARNSAFGVANIHALIQGGSAVSKVEKSLASIEQRLAALSNSMEAGNRKTKEITLSVNRKSFLERVPDFLENFGRGEYATLVLGAFPTEQITADEIYDGRSATVQAFEHPPELRQNGFGLSGYARSELVGGTLRRAISGSRKARQLTNSGKLFVGVAADDDFLGWAMNRRPGYPVTYRSFVLAEVTYIFAAYVRSIFDSLREKPQKLDILVGLRNSFVDGLPPRLGVAADHGHFHPSWIEPLPAPKPDILKTVRVPFDISIERLAFETRACLYRRFGFGDDSIPYATLTDEGRITTAQHILDVSQR